MKRLALLVAIVALTGFVTSAYGLQVLSPILHPELGAGLGSRGMTYQPVDLLFALLVPEEATEEHLQLLAQLARMLSDEQLVKQLRASPDAHSLFSAIQEWQKQH